MIHHVALEITLATQVDTFLQYERCERTRNRIQQAWSLSISRFDIMWCAHALWVGSPISLSCTINRIHLLQQKVKHHFKFQVSYV